VTVVVLMGLGRSAALACQLIDRGWSRGTPAAIIVDASRPQQQVWRGTLDDLARDAAECDGAGAGTLVIGDVVAIGMPADQEAVGAEANGHSATLSANSRSATLSGSRKVAQAFRPAHRV